jgi:hypothetical protein
MNIKYIKLQYPEEEENMTMIDVRFVENEQINRDRCHEQNLNKNPKPSY